MDRDGGSSDSALDQATLVLAFLVRAHDDPRGQCAVGEAAQNGGDVGSSDDEPRAAMASQSANQADGRHRLHDLGARAAC